MAYERIAYTTHAYRRMNTRRVSHVDVKRILNNPEMTYPSKDEPDRTVARGHLSDGRSAGVVFTEKHDRDADVLIVTVIDFGSEE